MSQLSFFSCTKTEDNRNNAQEQLAEYMAKQLRTNWHKC